MLMGKFAVHVEVCFIVKAENEEEAEDKALNYAILDSTNVEMLFPESTYIKELSENLRDIEIGTLEVKKIEKIREP